MSKKKIALIGIFAISVLLIAVIVNSYFPIKKTDYEILTAQPCYLMMVNDPPDFIKSDCLTDRKWLSPELSKNYKVIEKFDEKSIPKLHQFCALAYQHYLTYITNSSDFSPLKSMLYVDCWQHLDHWHFLQPEIHPQIAPLYIEFEHVLFAKIKFKTQDLQDAHDKMVIQAKELKKTWKCVEC